MAANDNVITCGALFTFEELLAGAIGKDATGHPYLRLFATENVSGSKFFTCGQPSDGVNLNAVLGNLFTLDSNGDVALRIASAVAL